MSWEDHEANLPERHFWTHEGGEGDEMTGSVNKGMKVDVIYLDFSKSFVAISQSIFSATWKVMACVGGTVGGLPALKSSKCKGQPVANDVVF